MKISARTWLTITGIGAAIMLLAPSTVIVAAASVVGIPVALGLVAAPFLFVVSLGSWLIGRRLAFGRAGYALGVGAMLLVLAVPPFLINAFLSARSDVFVAQDIDVLGKPLRVKAIALRGDGVRETACDGLCMRMLLNGVAARVLLVSQDLNAPLNAATPALSYRLEKRAPCPSVALSTGRDEIGDAGPMQRQAYELLQIEVAKGNCLFAETVALGTADAVISRGTVHRGQSAIGAGLNPFADTVQARRVSVHRRDGNGFREAYRRTTVVTQLLTPVLTASVEGVSGLSGRAVLVRSASRLNADAPYAEEPDWKRFLTGTLALDLKLREDRADEDVRNVLTAAIATPGAINDDAAKLAANFFEWLPRKPGMTADDRVLARSLLTETGFGVPSHAWAAVAHAGDAEGDYFEAIATSMFLRLASIADTDDGAPNPSWGAEARHIAEVLRHMPRATMLKHRADLIWLAQQERVRAWTYKALARLGELGAKAAPALLWLMDDAVRLKKVQGGSDWSNIYLAGLQGLCRMGDAGRAMIGPIYARLDADAMMKHANYWRLTIETLIGMGAAPYEMWPHLETGDSAQTRQHFMVEVERARGRRECGY